MFSNGISPSLVQSQTSDEPRSLKKEYGTDGEGATDTKRLKARQNLKLFPSFIIMNCDMKQWMVVSITLVRWTQTVTAPTPKAQTSVREVTVMATPAFLIVCPILSVRGRVDFCSSLKLLRHCMITNMSSIPIPVTKRERCYVVGCRFRR